MIKNSVLTAANCSTRGRKAGSSTRALSEGSWISPAFSPASSSLWKVSENQYVIIMNYVKVIMYGPEDVNKSHL